MNKGRSSDVLAPGAAGPRAAAAFWGPSAPVIGALEWARAFTQLPVLPIGEGGALVITDLHLPPLGGAATEAFGAWCAAVAAAALDTEAPAGSPASHAQAPRVVCLGDLFDSWVGRAQLRMPGTAPVVAAIAALGRAGVAFDLVLGNRDSLLDEAFAAATGARIHRDGLILEDEDGQRTLCVHGDDLCIREAGYLRLRALLRSRPIRGLARIAPLWFARGVGRGLRSHYAGARQPRGGDRGPQPDAALAAARAAGAVCALSGHSHAPEELELPGTVLLEVEPRPSVRWVTLGAFGEGRDEALIVRGAQCSVRDSHNSGVVETRGTEPDPKRR